MKLSIIIVSYNTKNFIKKCLNSIYETIDKNKISFEVIVIDNDSEDDSAEMVAKEFSQILLIDNRENIGFSKANNQGIKKAKGDYLFFLNPDTELKENSLATLIEFLEDHGEAGAVTSRVELPNGVLDDASHRGFPTPWNSLCYFLGLSNLFPKIPLFSGYTMGFKDLRTIHEIDACAGAVMLVRWKAGEEVGWWDEDFFWYGEDLDFCYRLKKKGWKIYFVPTVLVVHYKGVSGGIKNISKDISSATRETKIRSTQARFNAMRIFYNKHYKKQYPPIMSFFVLKSISAFKKIKLLTI